MGRQLETKYRVASGAIRTGCVYAYYHYYQVYAPVFLVPQTTEGATDLCLYVIVVQQGEKLLNW